MGSDNTLDILHRASAAVGLNSDRAEVFRLAENAIYRLGGGVVARIARTGQYAAAAKEVTVARWLEDSGVSAVRVLRDIDQPVQVDGRAVTFRHVCGLDWSVPAHRVENPAYFPQPLLVDQRFACEAVSDRDAGARWCSAVMSQALSPVIGR